MSQRVVVELSPSLDAREWARLHADGVVPDRVPYGLDRMTGHGLSVVVRMPPRSLAVRQVSRVGARLSAGARWPESLLSSPCPSPGDVRFCWEERAGIPAVLSQAGRRSRSPVVTGVIWITEHDARLSALARSAGRTALRRADAIFVLSAAQVPVLHAEWGIDSARLHFVPFGVDTDFWDPARASGDSAAGSAALAAGRPGCQTVLSVGNDRYRDHGLLLAAAQEASTKDPGIRLDLVTATRHEVPAAVGRWRSSVTHAELRSLYHDAAVVAICTRPNIHASGITAILEAMAMGKPVVASRTAGMEDYVAHGETGVLIPPGDPQALARAIIELVADPARCRALGAAARERALSHFSTQAMSHRLATVIRAACQSGITAD